MINKTKDLTSLEAVGLNAFGWEIVNLDIFASDNRFDIIALILLNYDKIIQTNRSTVVGKNHY